MRPPPPINSSTCSPGSRPGVVRFGSDSFLWDWVRLVLDPVLHCKHADSGNRIIRTDHVTGTYSYTGQVPSSENRKVRTKQNRDPVSLVRIKLGFCCLLERVGYQTGSDQLENICVMFWKLNSNWNLRINRWTDSDELNWVRDTAGSDVWFYGALFAKLHSKKFRAIFFV